MTPLPIDDRRVGKLADACDAIDAEQPRQAGWRDRHAAAYRALADAVNLAGRNASNRRLDASISGLEPKPGHAEGCGAHDDYECDCGSAEQRAGQP